MAKRKKVPVWKKILLALISPKLWLSIASALAVTALLSLTMIADNAYNQWRADQTEGRTYTESVQGHLTNVAPMIILCETRGGYWTWIGVDPAEVTGMCMKAVQQKGTAEEQQDYSETL